MKPGDRVRVAGRGDEVFLFVDSDPCGLWLSHEDGSHADSCNIAELEMPPPPPCATCAQHDAWWDARVLGCMRLEVWYLPEAICDLLSLNLREPAVRASLARLLERAAVALGLGESGRTTVYQRLVDLPSKPDEEAKP